MSQAVFGLSLIYVVRMLGLFMVLPVLSLALEDYESATPTMIGLALGIYGGTQGLFQLPLAALSDKLGRKPIITIGLLMFVVGSLVAAQAEEALWIVIGRALQGAGAIAATIMALMADLTPEDRRARAMASIGASIGIAFAVSMVLGPAIYAALGLSGVFNVAAVLALLGIAILWFVVPSPDATVHDNDVRATGLREALTSPELMRAAIGVFVLHGALMGMFLTVPSLIERLDVVEQSQLSLFYLSIIGTSFLAMIPFIVMAEAKRRMRAALRIAVATIWISTGVLFLSADREWFILGLWLFFLGFNLAEALLPSLVSKIAPVGRRGAAMGLYSTAQFLGAFVGAMIAGVLSDGWGVKAPFLMAFAGVMIWLVAVSKMQPVTYLKNESMSLQGRRFEDLHGKILALSGVVSVRFESKTDRIYLKVDGKEFDRAALLALRESH